MKPHPLDVSSLVIGLIFLGISTGWLLYELEVATGPDLMWYLPVVLIIAGILGITLSATKGRRGRNHLREWQHGTGEPESPQESTIVETNNE